MAYLPSQPWNRWIWSRFAPRGWCGIRRIWPRMGYQWDFGALIWLFRASETHPTRVKPRGTHPQTLKPSKWTEYHTRIGCFEFVFFVHDNSVCLRQLTSNICGSQDQISAGSIWKEIACPNSTKNISDIDRVVAEIQLKTWEACLFFFEKKIATRSKRGSNL